MTERLKSKEKIVGLNQVKRALNNSEISTLYLAEDADEEIINQLIEECEGKKVEIIKVESMKELGRACDIDINAAVAALVK